MATAMIRTTSKTGPKEEKSIGSSSGSGSTSSLLSIISGEIIARNVKLRSSSFSDDERLCLQRVAPPYSIRTIIFGTWTFRSVRNLTLISVTFDQLMLCHKSFVEKVTKIIFCGIWVRQLVFEVFVTRLSGFEQGSRKKRSIMYHLSFDKTLCSWCWFTMHFYTESDAGSSSIIPDYLRLFIFRLHIEKCVHIRPVNLLFLYSTWNLFLFLIYISRSKVDSRKRKTCGYVYLGSIFE